MKILEINEIPEIIKAAEKSTINIMILGDTGVGKTAMVEKFAKDNGFYIKTLILSQLEASESLGIPVQTEEIIDGRKMQVLSTAIPKWVLELKAQKKAILFLDEFLTAPPAVMNAFLNFLSQKTVEGIDLSHVKVIAATNISNYTFDPDYNILSRFAMFYVVNNTFNEYVNDPRIKNDYRDEAELSGILFEERSLKPRCQFQLKDIDDEYLHIFYEGFTNRELKPIFSKTPEINAAINGIARKNGKGKYCVEDYMLGSLALILVKSMPKIQKWDNRINQIKNLDLDKDKLLAELNRVLKEGTEQVWGVFLWWKYYAKLNVKYQEI